jgi:hypothetical protein
MSELRLKSTGTIYDTEDKTAIEAKRAEIKLKYPKPGA